MLQIKGITQTKTFWFLFSLASIAGILFSYKYFYKAVPIVTIDIKMNRKEALEKAKKLAKTYNWGPRNFTQAASFYTDEKTKIFVDLEGGGKKAFIKMIEENLYMPYTWLVRLFKEQEKNETIIKFTPDGKPYGFKQVLSENAPGEKLPKNKANIIATTFATQWGIDLSLYIPVESSTTQMPSGRIDHTFIYERIHKKIGNGLYRLKLMVSGDKVSELNHFIKIPDEFPKKYAQMRAANDGIARVASLLLLLLYIIGGCIIGTSLLMKQKYVIWRAPFITGFIISFFMLLEKINNIPLLWINYNTAESSYNFIFSYLIKSFIGFLSFLFLYVVTFAAAESLTRKAFGKQIQFWKLFSKKNLNSKQILGRTIGAYLLVGISVGIIIATYLFSTRFLGWWLPYGELVNPNIIATYFPWISAIAIPLSAGFWEECMFRAVPLAGAAIIGTRLGKRNLWIAGALILQALIFGAAHANYPTQPAYARLIELIIPSLIYGTIYLRFGLLPVIISHFLYDVVFFAMPIFISSGPNAISNQIIVIFLAVLPLLVVLYAYFRSGKWTEINPDEINNAWQPTKQKIEKKYIPITPKIVKLKPIKYIIILSFGILGIFFWIIFTPFTRNAPNLNITQQQAIVIAKKTLVKNDISIPKNWIALPVLYGSYNKKIKAKLQHRFIWQSDNTLYKKLLGNYLYNPLWIVRFVTFTGTIAQRSEEYRVFIDQNGRVIKISHKIPEDKIGAHLNEKQARMIAHNYIREILYIPSSHLKEISAQSKKLPNRIQWAFTFEDTKVYPLEQGQARITIKIDGDAVSNIQKYIHIPEQWERNEINKQSLINIFTIICLFLLFLLGGYALVVISKKDIIFSKKTVILSFFGLFSLILLLNINYATSIMATFNTIEPFYTQLFQKLSSILITTLFISSITSILIGVFIRWQSKTAMPKNIMTFIVGISTGMFLVGSTALINYFKPSLQPLWPDYRQLASTIPIFSIITINIIYFLFFTCIAILLVAALAHIYNILKNKKTLLYAILTIIFILAGIATIGIHHLDNITFWIIGGTIMGLLCLIVYVNVIRVDISLIPMIIASFIITWSLQQAIFNAFPGTSIGFIASAIIILLLSFLIFKKLNNNKIRPCC